MHILFLTGSPAHYMAPPQLGDTQIVAGPDWPDAQSPQGNWISIKAPVGDYDIITLLNKLPAEQQPDAVVSLVDASWRNTPRNLAAFNGPKALLIADTHHLSSPLIGMLKYAASEPYDRIVFLYDRHHLSFFHSAGFNNLYWFPGLTFPHDDDTVKAARMKKRDPRIAFVGQSGKFHPRRARLLDALKKSKLPLDQQRLSQRKALEFYGSSAIGLNASLNGDLNLRVFEIIASGAALLTDGLASESGLFRLFTEGKDIFTYGTQDELIERAKYNLIHPRETAEVGLAGSALFDRLFNAPLRRATFLDLLVDGKHRPEFAEPANVNQRVYFGGNTDQLLPSIIAYEKVQELHRVQEQVNVVVGPDAPACISDIFSTLPNVILSNCLATIRADIIVASISSHKAVAASGATRLWCWDATEAEMRKLSDYFLNYNYKLESNDIALYYKSTDSSAQKCASKSAGKARMLFEQGDINGALNQSGSALKQDGACIAAITVLADIALIKHNGVLAEKLLRQALRLAPKEAGIMAALAEALIMQSKTKEAEIATNDALRIQPDQLRALLAYAKLHEESGHPSEGLKSLRLAVEYHPKSPMAANRLGLALRLQGRLLDGLAWQRRALGIVDKMTTVDPCKGPVRIAFLVQHPQGWTSLESVWRAMAEDPAFAPVIIAAPYRHPYPSEGGPDAIFGFLTKQGVPFVRWEQFPLKPGFADVVFVQNPYDITRPAPLRTRELLKLVPRLAYVPYGLEIGGGNTNATNQFNLPLQQAAWAIFARSPRHRAMFAKHCAAGDQHVTVTGHPRLDLLQAIEKLPACAALSRFARGRKIIFWNPQFDIRADGTGYSTFLLWQDFLLQEFTLRQDLALVIRPHPLFFGALESRRIWSREQVDAFVHRVEHSGNIVIDRDASYLPVFGVSAAMLSDASTFLLEYAATGKPFLYLHNAKGPSLNSDGEFIRAHAYSAETAEAIKAFLDQVACGQDPRATERNAAYPEVMHRPAGGVAAAIKDQLLARLAAEASTATPATTTV